MDLNFEVRKQIISRTDKEKVVNLSENYLRLCFTFKTDDWNGLTKFALFKHDDSTTRIGLVEDMVVVPSSLLSGDRLVFSIYGLDTPNDEVYRITTNLVRLYLLNSGYTSDVDDPIDEEEVDIVEEIYIAIGTKADAVHTHTKSDITDFSHTHTKSEISDFTHSHTKSDITDFTHNHDERYYTEDEVNTIIDELKHDLNNRVILTSDKNIIQTNEKSDLTAYAVIEGIPQQNKEVYFYIKEEE